jgi:hypothetical protein
VSRPVDQPRSPCLRRSFGALSLALAVYVVAVFLLGIGGLQTWLLQSPGGLLVYNALFGVLPTLLWLTVVGGLWWLSRETPGNRLMTAALAVLILEQVLENVWPVLAPGLEASVLNWTATVVSIAGPLMIALGLRESRIVSDGVARLALLWGITHALIGSTRVVFNLFVGSSVPLEIVWLERALFAYASTGLALLRIAVIVGTGLSLMSLTAASGREVRLTSASS